MSKAKASKQETSRKKDGEKRYIYLITDVCDMKLKDKDLDGLTESEIISLIQSYCGSIEIYIHINDDDSVAVALNGQPAFGPRMMSHEYSV